jgi:hypothetical protein
MWWFLVGIVVVVVAGAVALRRRRRGSGREDPARLAHQQENKSFGRYGDHF